MRILIITQKVDSNDDLLAFFESWIREISYLAEEVNVIALSKGEFDLPKNVKVVSLGKENGANKIIQAVKFYFYAFKFLKKSDGIFVHMAPEYVRALYPLNIFFRKPTVLWYAHIKVSPVAKWAINHVNFVVTPSKESFLLDSPKVISTGHGINTDLFKPSEKIVSDKKIMTISRISKVKRIETLIEALNVLVNKKNIKDIKVDIYGDVARKEDKDYIKSLKALALKYNLNEYLNWKGAIKNKDAPLIYADHSLFVRMQGGGGFGKTELEAMSVGIPAILPTDVYKKDLGEFANELYFPEDDFNTLADRIENTLNWNLEKKQKYLKIARELVVTKHNVKNVAGEVVRLLKEASLG
jgi:glycosyltransferase involved in cell wall biosynthesis